MRKLALSDEILMKADKPARYIGNEFNLSNERHIAGKYTFCDVFS